MIETVAGIFSLALALVRSLVFVAGVVAALGAVGSWAVRTRRISPFSGLARFIKSSIDPWLVAPMERRLLRAGGTPYAAPWWGLAAVVLGGLLLIWALEFVRNELVTISYAIQTGQFGVVLVRWTFSVLRIALFARIIASWVGGSPYSKWWRWSYTLTEWFLAPLRQIIPTIGMIDITVLVAYFALGFLESAVMRVLM